MAFDIVDAADRTVLAEGTLGDWHWLLEVWRQDIEVAGPDKSLAGEQILYTVRDADRPVAGGRILSAFHEPAEPSFFQAREGDGSVLCGPVVDGVEKVIVEPTEPAGLPPREADVVGGDTDFGSFFVVALPEPVLRATVRVEPAERFKRPSTWTFNLKLQMLRQIRDGHIVGNGRTKEGKAWRLRVRPDGEQRQVDLAAGRDEAFLDQLDKRGVTGNGFGPGPPLAADAHIKISAAGGGMSGPSVIGEISDRVARVSVLFGDSDARPAEICRSDVTPGGFFVAFVEDHRAVTGAVAYDENGEVLGVVPWPPTPRA